MKKTEARESTRCDECGTYDLVCSSCKKEFKDGQSIYCDDG